MDHALDDVSTTSRLTKRELQVLQLMEEDLSLQAMADQLQLSAATLKWYTRRIYDKLGIRGNHPKRLVATTWARRMGWLEIENRAGNTSRGGLPTPATPFIGRAEELDHVAVRMSDPAVRLVTLIGPGGIGKTRLAIRIAAQIEDQFLDGVAFADLQPVQSVEYLPAAIAKGVGVALSGQGKPAQQLLHRLRDRHMLLVLDNLEHLLDGADLLMEILSEAPEVKLLVTARQPLNIQAEWRCIIHGLTYPAPGTVDGATSDAVQLFEARARQAQADFNLADEMPHVIRICQMVEGMPLALELAASWLHALSCAQVAEEIEQSLHFLTTTLRDLPDRHRSMAAVFEPSWAQLSEEEREGFMRLSVFRGGFSRAAAAEVAGVSLPLLAQLVERRLLQRLHSGRYRMQELVRQYAAERLADAHGRSEEAQGRHCTYFLGYVRNQEPDLKGARMPEALQQIADDLDNIRAAWKWAIEATNFAYLDAALFGLAYFYYVRSMNHEAVSALESLRAALPEGDSTLAGSALLWEAACLLHYGHVNLGIERGMHGLRMLRRQAVCGLTTPPIETMTRCLPLADEVRAEIRAYAEQGLEVCRREEDAFGIAHLLLTLRNLAVAENRQDLVKHYVDESLAVIRTIDHPWAMGQLLWSLKDFAVQEGRYEDAHQTLEEIARLGELVGDPGAPTAAEMQHAEVALLQGNHAQAARWLESHIVHNDSFNPNSASPVHALNLLARIAVTTGDHAGARRHLRSGAQRLAGGDYPPALIARCLTMNAPTLADLGLAEWAVAAASHSRYLAPFEAEESGAPTLLERLEQELEESAWEAGWARGTATDPADLAKALYAVLAKDEPMAALPENRRRTGYAAVHELSMRELEVLRLVSEGRSNREIAEALVVTLGTVKKHLNNAFSKLPARSRTQAIVRAKELGLLG